MIEPDPVASMPPPDARTNRELTIFISVWLAISTVLASVTIRNLSAPGLNYDEAVFAGLAKDFVTGSPHGQHMPGTQAVNLLGRPFPLFVQPYLGTVKSWLIIPSFTLFKPSIAVLRLTALGWTLLALMLFMLWTWKLLGLPASLLAGACWGWIRPSCSSCCTIGGRSSRVSCAALAGFISC